MLFDNVSPSPVARVVYRNRRDAYVTCLLLVESSVVTPYFTCCIIHPRLPLRQKPSSFSHLHRLVVVGTISKFEALTLLSPIHPKPQPQHKASVKSRRNQITQCRCRRKRTSVGKEHLGLKLSVKESRGKHLSPVSLLSNGVRQKAVMTYSRSPPITIASSHLKGNPNPSLRLRIAHQNQKAAKRGK